MSLRGGSGRRALAFSPDPISEGRSAEKVTSSSGVRAIARMHEATARLNGSCGASLAAGLRLEGACQRLHGARSASAKQSRAALWLAVSGSSRRACRLITTFTALSGNSLPKQRW